LSKVDYIGLMKALILFSGIVLFCGLHQLAAQKSVPVTDQRGSDECSACETLIMQKPKEVLFGVNTLQNGDVYFSMDNINWFKKIFQNDLYGVAVDIISEDRYNCQVIEDPKALPPKGILLPTVFRKELLSKNESTDGGVYVKVGSIPSHEMNRKIEGNLIIVNYNKICHYTEFVNISRVGLDLLPMGLFANTLTKADNFFNDSLGVFTYSEKKQIIIPFKKATSTYDQAALKKAYDSLKLERYRIQKIEIRAYSSVEGPETLNMQLMRKRGEAMIQFLKLNKSALKRSSVLTAENWLDFFSDIEGTAFDSLRSFSKSEIKRKLTESTLAKKIEPILAKERKAVAVLYLEPKSSRPIHLDVPLDAAFKLAIQKKRFKDASAIQKDVIEQIADNKLPSEYLEKLEVPKTKECFSLLNDREVYKYLFQLTFESEALDNFLQLQKLDPQNGHINYNISALKLIAKKLGYDNLLQNTLLQEIGLLTKQGIHQSLVNRMRVNYYILKCEDFMRQLDYEAKDTTLELIHDIYDSLEVSDEDVYSLARYYSQYSHNHWALEIITPRIDKIDASEDLIFYYINLLFYHPSEYDSEAFKKASLNAINLNRKRYCHFFSPADKGGASMQLLDYKSIRNLWCQNCR
jgi:hypothetical protein